jgi:hypothetical protein
MTKPASSWGGQYWPQPPFRRPSFALALSQGRLKAGCSHDWLPHFCGPVVFAAVVGILTAGLGLPATTPAATENAGKQQVRVSKTEHVDFAPGGTIRINGSHGDLNVEGWDRPDVEVTVIKSTGRLYSAKETEDARKRLDLIAVTLDHKSASELTISTRFPSRKLTRLNRGRSNLILEYQIHVPRASHLIVRQDMGAVVVTGVAGDVDGKVGSGDIVVMVPAAGSYAIDAKTRFGGVDSDFGGAANREGLIGRQLGFAPSSPQHKIVLRVGFGNINVQALPAARAPQSGHESGPGTP